MATFLRRKFNKLVTKDDTPSSLTVSRPEGVVAFTKKELQRYSQLFTMLDSDADEQIGGVEGAAFLRRSGLSNEQLREVWRLASGGASKPTLGKEDWLLACKLVAVVQGRGVEPAMGLIAGESGTGCGVADFNYGLSPDLGGALAVGGGEFLATAIRVTVTNPTTFGSGMSKHTRYQVTTSTSLSHFARKEMQVWRRFSDFEWLHKRLSVTFPAAIIPLFPEKRVVGNQEESFIASRMSSLETYIDKVAHHPTLSTSLDLLVFLDATDAGLEAAKCYIEAVAAEEAESILARGMDAMMALAGKDSTPALEIKTDEAFIAACTGHGAALARLQHLAKAGSGISTAVGEYAATLVALGKALSALATHERNNASAGASAAAAVAAAAAQAKRAEEVLFTGSATSGGGSSDSAAAAAFASHSAAMADAAGSNDIAAMFKADFHDPYSALHAAAAAPSGGAGGLFGGGGGSSSEAETIADLLDAAGKATATAGSQERAFQARVDASLLTFMTAERDKASELALAIKRRDGAVERVQEANREVGRKKKALAGLKPTEKDYNAKFSAAQAAVEKAERALTSRQEELAAMTEQLKAEIARVDVERRRMAVAHLAEHARVQAEQARMRADAWRGLLPVITADSAVLDRAREDVAAIARKAEARARANASAAATGGKGRADSTASAGDVGAAGGAGAAFVGSSDLPIPSASDL